MFRQIWNKICNIYDSLTTSTAVETYVISRHRGILNTIRSAENLSQLLEAKKSIREFHLYLVDVKLEYKFRYMVVGLTSYWNAKYNYWKRKMRNR